jgi:hypothetical protein
MPLLSTPPAVRSLVHEGQTCLGFRGLFCLGLIATGLAVPIPASAQEAPFVRDVFAGINAQRTKQSLPRLSSNKTLEKAGQAHDEWMARNRQMEHLQDPPASFDQHRTCNHHPIHRAINAGSIEWDEAFRVEKTPTGAVVHPKPKANDLIGEIIAAGCDLPS